MGANGISDRSGFKHKMRDMIKEPGTGYLVHKRESDGIYNQVDHPQAHLSKWAKLSGDPKPVKNARPDEDRSISIFLTDENGNILVSETNTPIEVY